jgi:hypothetical protein
VVKPVGHQPGQHLLAGVSERRVPQVVAHHDRLGQRLVEPQRPRHRARDLRHLQRVGDTGAVVIPLGRQEDLGLARQAAERLRMDDAIAIVLEDRTHRIGGFGPRPALAGAAALGEG